MFYENLKHLCFERGISLSKMAVELGISTTTVTGWKRGAKPQSALVRKIAEYFDVTADELLSETPTAAATAELPSDGKVDWIDILKSQQYAILNFSESNKSQSKAIENNSEANKNQSKAIENISGTSKELAESIKNFSEAHKNISVSNKNLSASIKKFAEVGGKRGR